MLVVIQRLSDVLGKRQQWRWFNFTASKERLIIRASYMIGLIYIAMCSFHYSEFYFGKSTSEDFSLMTCFYFIMITISTVGYGDVTPTTIAGQWVAIFTIILAISILPGIISALVETISSQNAGGGAFNGHGHPFIVICGKFEHANELTDILNEFYFRKTLEKKSLKIVFLSTIPATDSIKAIVNQSSYRQRITFLYGSPLSPYDMVRIQLDKASAAFMIPGNFFVS